jgi:hypothetical protein
MSASAALPFRRRIIRYFFGLPFAAIPCALTFAYLHMNKISLLLSLLVLSGCVTTGPGSRFTRLAPTDEYATVYFYRTFSLIGSGTYPHIHINGERRDALVVSSYLVYRFRPGRYSIVADGDSFTFPFPASRFEMDFEAGKEYFFRFETSARNSYIAGSVVVSQWNNSFFLDSFEEASDAIMKLKLNNHDPNSTLAIPPRPNANK